MARVADVAAELRAARLAAGLTQDQLAVAAEVGSATVGRIENGHVVPRPATMRALYSVLNSR